MSFKSVPCVTQWRRASMARRHSNFCATRTRTSIWSFQTSTCLVRSGLPPMVSVLGSRGLLPHEVVVDISSPWWMQTWTASDCWSKWGWRWIFQSSVRHIGSHYANAELQHAVIWLTCPVWRATQNGWTFACCPAVMSSNGETSVVLRGVTHGAVDFLIKPVRVEELRNVWQHVVRRRKDKVRLRM